MAFRASVSARLMKLTRQVASRSGPTSLPMNRCTEHLRPTTLARVLASTVEVRRLRAYLDREAHRLDPVTSDGLACKT